MKYRALTVSREYGSGGAEIAGILAARLGWKLVDQALLRELSAQAKRPLETVASLDERVDPWIERVISPFWAIGAGYIAPPDPFDADAAADLTRRIIEAAYHAGDCVIVGRGSQCVLRDRPDVFHVFIYARWADRMRRVRTRVPAGADVGQWIRKNDDQRREYIHRHYDETRLDPHLYDLLIDSQNGSEATARLIVAAMEAALESKAEAGG